MAVTKKHVVDEIIMKIGFSGKESYEVLESLLEIMKNTLESGDNIMISGFGKFSVKKKNERLGRNPATSEPLMLEPRKVVTFQHSVTLKERMNDN